jgi:C-terminal processing protease CtpA/Prc
VVSHAGVDVPTLDPAAEAAAISRREVILKREVIKTESVFGDRRRPDGGWDWMIEGVAGVAYAHIAVFGEQTAKELATAIDDMVARGEVRALVLDVRGNPGGLLAAAVEVCDLFLDEGVIVQTRGRRDAGTGETATSELRRATVGQRLAGVPMVVLIDGLTASAAEIVAACLQDSGRATICGSRTFGKGTVQSILPLSDDRGLIRLTTSEYVRPSRANIHRRVGDGDHAEWGVTPDAGFELTPTAESNARLAGRSADVRRQIGSHRPAVRHRPCPGPWHPRVLSGSDAVWPVRSRPRRPGRNFPRRRSCPASRRMIGPLPSLRRASPQLRESAGRR